MTLRKNSASRRIPLQVLDDDRDASVEHATDADDAEWVRLAADTSEEDEGGVEDMTHEESERASIYQGETELERDVDRRESDSQGNIEQADDADVADERPESRDDQDAMSPHAHDASGAQSVNAVRQNPPRPSSDAAAGPVIAELVATRAELRRVEGELQRAEDELQKVGQSRTGFTEAQARLQADFDNFRKRTERARGEAHQSLVGEITSRLLPIADNFRRAIETSAETAKSEEFKQFTLGIELIRKQLDDVLSHYGVEPIPAVGEPFDPHVHEAIATETTDEVPPNTITEEIVRGYRLGDKLLRPAMVKVAAP